MSDEPQRPTTDDRDAWKAYWTAQGMPWRTEPEIESQRYAYLAERRAITPNIEQDIYPFRDENGSIKLDRADVEWLLATHESGGHMGPVDWTDESQREREGLDLRGADLRGVGLSHLPLAGLQGGLHKGGATSEVIEQRNMAAVRLERADLTEAQLDRAELSGAHLGDAMMRHAQMEQVRLSEAHMDGVKLREAYLEGADLRAAHMERADLFKAHLSRGRLGEAHLTNANLQQAHLESCQLTGANLQAASLQAAFLAGADLRKAHLQHAKLREADLQRVDFGQANLQDADLLRARLQRARLSEARAQRVKLHGAHLEGARLRAAQLTGANLNEAHLEEAHLLRAHLEGASFQAAHLDRANLREAHLEGADLHRARLVDANLRKAHLEAANLRSVHLEQADLSEAYVTGRRTTADERELGQNWCHGALLSEVLSPADLRGASLDSGTNLTNLVLGDDEYGYVPLADVHWGGANLTLINWSSLEQAYQRRRGEPMVLGDERLARRKVASTGKRKGTDTQFVEFEAAVRANRQLAVALREQGLNEYADRFAYHAQVLQRQVLRRQRQLGRAFGSWLLDMVAGYGYKPMRSVFTYIMVVLGFAAAYFIVGGAHGQALAWNEALVVSMTAFHGRGFFGSAFQPGDPQAALAAIEALFGLLIEITFIATFTQRFFAR